ncbi:hypothetical protein ACJ73_00167 [Blastomyces percursus]|uniref:Uncharacterized protein n=1 Tax=Blastomyces percursus TaxID=1658174 RepID=A0A1J9R7P8_9EURO|nr:hypothetical protein ACJ73_00167 [Blastomyces percursus]
MGGIEPLGFNDRLKSLLPLEKNRAELLGNMNILLTGLRRQLGIVFVVDWRTTTKLNSNGPKSQSSRLRPQLEMRNRYPSTYKLANLRFESAAGIIWHGPVAVALDGVESSRRGIRRDSKVPQISFEFEMRLLEILG